MKKRLNDTAAIASAPPRGGESHHISTREIENGWLVESSVCNERTGEYRSSTKFVETAPRIIPGRAARVGASPDSSTSLRQTMDYLKEGK